MCKLTPSVDCANAEDDRPLVKDLLAKHASQIEGVKAILTDDPLYGANADRYDELWILRFVLTHKGDVDVAGKAALSTIRFREERKLNDLGDVRHMTPCLSAPNDVCHPSQAKYASFCTKSNDTFQHWQPDESRGVLTIVDAPKIDTKGLSALSTEEIADAYTYTNESLFQINDEVTRRTGKLTKLARVINLSGWSYKNVSTKYVKKDAAANVRLENYYPQLVGSLFVVGMPGWLVKIYNTVIVLMLPSRIKEKVHFMPPAEKMKPSDLEHYLGYVSEENLPARFGGKNEEWPLESARNKFNRKE